MADFDGTVRSDNFSRSGRWMIAGGDDKMVRLWDLAAVDPANSSIVFRGHKNPVSNVSMSEDDCWLVSVGREVRIWDLRIDKLLEKARRVVGRKLTYAECKRFNVDENLQPEY